MFNELSLRYERYIPLGLGTFSIAMSQAHSTLIFDALGRPLIPLNEDFLDTTFQADPRLVASHLHCVRHVGAPAAAGGENKGSRPAQQPCQAHTNERKVCEDQESIRKIGSPDYGRHKPRQT